MTFLLNRAKEKYLHNKTKIIFILVLFVLSLGVFFIVGRNFIPSKEETQSKDRISSTACLAAGPYPLIANTPVEISLRFLESGDCGKPETYKPLKGLTVAHESIMHVFIVNEDMTVFAHMRPEDFGPIEQEMLDNSHFVVNYIFPSVGKWRIAVEIMHENEVITKSFDLVLGESLKPVSLLKDLSLNKVFLDENNKKYEVVLDPIGKIVAGKEAILNYHIENAGEPVADLEPYFKEAANFAIWSIDLASFYHEYGFIGSVKDGTYTSVDALPDSFGPDIYLTHVFPYPGLWKIFGQFKRGEEIITTDFMVVVGRDSN